MLIKVNQNSIVTLMLISFAILSCPAFASDEALLTHHSEPNSPELSSQPKAPPPPQYSEKLHQEYLLQEPEQNWLKSSLHSLEIFQVWLGGYVQDTGVGIDNYFGTEEAFDSTKDSRLDIMTPVVFHDSGEVEMQMRFRAKLALPKLRKNWHLLFSTQDATVKNRGNNDLVNEIYEEEGEALLGLQALLDPSRGHEIYLDAGARFNNVTNLDPYIRVKKRYKFALTDSWSNRMTHSVFWERVAGPGLDSKVVFDKSIDQKHLFRSQTDGTWWYDGTYYEMTQRLLLYKIINPYRILSYQAWTTLDSQTDNFKQTGYGFALNWRERAYKTWLYFEVEPAVRWVDEDKFSDADVTLMIMLEMRFFKNL